MYNGYTITVTVGNDGVVVIDGIPGGYTGIEHVLTVTFYNPDTEKVQTGELRLPGWDDEKPTRDDIVNPGKKHSLVPHEYVRLLCNSEDVEVKD